jgi:polar amino acid transport system substrate-binding protein
MRPLRALLLGLLVVALGACQSFPGRAPGAARLQGVLDSRELRVGLSGNQPPLNMKDKHGQIIGLEVDLVEALARAMGLEARLVVKPFAALLPALEKGEVDLVISGMTITPERNARVAFAGPYFISGKSVLTRSKKIANVESTAALDDPDRTYAALAGSTSERFVKDALPQAKLVATQDYDSAVQMVIDDKVDALVAHADDALHGGAPRHRAPSRRPSLREPRGELPGDVGEHRHAHPVQGQVVLLRLLGVRASLTESHGFPTVPRPCPQRRVRSGVRLGGVLELSEAERPEEAAHGSRHRVRRRARWPRGFAGSQGPDGAAG